MENFGSAMHTQRTKGELESEISQVIIRLERDLMGRGPLDTRTYLVDDMVVVRLRGVLTPAEEKLVANGNSGPQLVKQMREELLACKRPHLEQAVRRALGVGVRSVYTDINPEAGERVIVMILTGKPDAIESRKESGS